MMVKIILSEDIVMCFKYCANRCDYTMFIAEYQSFLNALSELLKPASFPKEFECNFVSMHLKLFVDVLLHWNDSECSSYLESHVPELLQDVKYSMSRGPPFVNTTIRLPVKSKHRAKEEEKKFGRRKAQTNVQNGRTLHIVTSGSLPPPVLPGAGFSQVRCGHPFSELSLRIFNFVIGVSENDSTGSTEGQCIFTACIGIRMKMIRTMIEKERMELQMYFSRRIEIITRYQNEVEEQINVLLDLFQQGQDNARVIEESLECKESMLAQLETKKRELNEETRERKEQFELWVKKLCKILEIDQEKFIKEQLEWAETGERGSPNDDPVSVEESRHCECTTCTMNLVWIKIGGAEMNSVRSSLDGAAEQIASEYVCEKNQEGLEQLQQILLSKIEMANERGEKMIEALKKDKEERNMKANELLSIIKSKSQTGRTGASTSDPTEEAKKTFDDSG